MMCLLANTYSNCRYMLGRRVFPTRTGQAIGAKNLVMSAQQVSVKAVGSFA